MALSSVLYQAFEQTFWQIPQPLHLAESAVSFFNVIALHVPCVVQLDADYSSLYNKSHRAYKNRKAIIVYYTRRLVNTSLDELFDGRVYDRKSQTTSVMYQ